MRVSKAFGLKVFGAEYMILQVLIKVTTKVLKKGVERSSINGEICVGAIYRTVLWCTAQ